MSIQLIQIKTILIIIHAKDPEFFKINKYFIDQKLNFSSIGMQAHMQTDDNVMSEKRSLESNRKICCIGKKYTIY